jgi:hypothetical protein
MVRGEYARDQFDGVAPEVNRPKPCGPGGHGGDAEVPGAGNDAEHVDGGRIGGASMKTKRMSFQDYSRSTWNREFTLNDDGTFRGLDADAYKMGLQCRIAESLETLVRLVKSTNSHLTDIFIAVKSLDPEVKAAAKKQSEANAKAEREKESRARSEAIFRGVAQKSSPTLLTPVGDLSLSARAAKVMRRMGLTTIGQLVMKTGDELLEERNFGVTSLYEVREKLKKIGLCLADETASEE